MAPIAKIVSHTQRFRWVLHVLFWATVLVAPFLLADDFLSEDPTRPLRLTIPIVFAIAVFYFNYSWLVDRLLFKSLLSQFLLANASLLVISVFAMEIIRVSFLQTSHHPIQLFAPFLLFRQTFLLLLTAGAGVGLRAIIRFYEEDRLNQVRDHQRLGAELRYLKNQINPHFFFNTLNNIYSLTQLKPEEAGAAIHRLANLMRYLLYESEAGTVLLSKELKFLANYTELMMLRLSQQVELQQSYSWDGPDWPLAPLLFLPLIENTFKHGVSKHGGFIKLGIEPTENGIRFWTENSCPKPARQASDGGIGLQNLRERLEILYPAKHKLSLEPKPGAFYASLELQLK